MSSLQRTKEEKIHHSPRQEIALVKYTNKVILSLGKDPSKNKTTETKEGNTDKHNAYKERNAARSVGKTETLFSPSHPT